MRKWGVLLALICLFSFPSTVGAHPNDTGYSTLDIDGNRVSYRLFVVATDMPMFDANLDKRLTQEELDAQSEAILHYITEKLRIESGGQPLTQEQASMQLSEKATGAGVEFLLQYQWNTATARLQNMESIDIHYQLFFDDGAPAHQSILLAQGENLNYQDVAHFNQREFHIDLFQGGTSANLWHALWVYFVLGIEHIVFGYDHLLFLLLLAIASVRVKEILIIVTAFTISHSLTLLLVASGRIQADLYWVEIFIAISIGYVALENILVKEAKWRWALTGVFGLIHGMGFAGALAETGLPKSNIIMTLLSFNIGIEAGQLALLAVFMPLLFWLRKFGWYRNALIVVSGFMLLLACYWVIQRSGLL
ncbi:HupE/UreJ family protein [Paenibacillus sp. J5C_2022]|uniref:HupE/UreJ family protein n=1 Tax=Paenibacillus sp. J5C2022 TaxID=2977129 RepID=UPI0021CF6701|nr:HupE/UreJ family protein [Paenibacillus sp. J5C2022]MCU6708061.1 HupE/UreJ family protein [Paenibacillus sp. J5C2022]